VPQKTASPRTGRRSPSGAPSAAESTRGAIHRAVAVLNAFTRQNRWGVRELAADLGVPKSGVHRTLQDLQQEGLLLSDDDGVYVVAGGLMHLAAGLLRSVDLTRVAQPHLEAARDQGGETAILTTFDPRRRQITAIEAVETHHPIQFAWQALRGWVDLHLSASGMGVLAFLEPKEIDLILSKRPVDANGKRVDVSAMRDELEQIRKRGWAYTRSARIAGSCGVSAPVFDAAGKVIGGVVIAWPDRGNAVDGAEASLGPICRSAAIQISRELGWTPDGKI
jgi:DNA-binding IclR family transcriptional regulator